MKSDRRSLRRVATPAALALLAATLDAAPQCDPGTPKASESPNPAASREGTVPVARLAVGLPRINEPAPDFEAVTTDGVRRLSDYQGRWLILFSHPADFTPVCTTEFIGFAKAYDRFQALNTDLLGLSIDSLYSHIAWKRTIHEKFGVEIPFPIIDDLSMRVAGAYGMIHPGASSTAAVRATFVINPQGILRAMVYYPMSNGRSVDEFVRLVEALQISDREHRATPEGWRPGDGLIVPPPSTSAAAEERMRAGYECKDWFFCTTSAAPERESAHAGPTPVGRETLEPDVCGQVKRLHTYAGFYLASQPRPADFEQAKRDGIKTVINQRHATEIEDFDEREVVTHLGLAYHTAAWNGVDELTDEVLDETRELLRTAQRPLLIHCGSANRTGAAWLAFRVLDQDLPIEEAVSEAKIVGLRSLDYERIVREYIRRRLATKAVTQ